MIGAAIGACGLQGNGAFIIGAFVGFLAAVEISSKIEVGSLKQRLQDFEKLLASLFYSASDEERQACARDKSKQSETCGPEPDQQSRVPLADTAQVYKTLSTVFAASAVAPSV